MLHSKDPPFIASPLLLFMSSVNGCDNGVAVPGCIWAGMQQLQRNRPVECCGKVFAMVLNGRVKTVIEDSVMMSEEVSEVVEGVQSRFLR